MTLYEVGTGRRLVRFAGHLTRVSDLAFSPDGKRLFSGSEDTTVLVWGVAAVLRTRPR